MGTIFPMPLDIMLLALGGQLMLDPQRMLLKT